MKTSGFTLVETLVAVTILIVGVIGPLSLAARGISDGLFAQNQLTANLLAQEALETIANLRNSNILANPLNPFAGIWDEDELRSNGLDGAIVNTGIDAKEGTLDYLCTHEEGGNDMPGCFLNYQGDHYQKAAAGPFLRQISLSKPADDELKVVVTISWLNKTVPKTFVISEYLYAK